MRWPSCSAASRFSSGASIGHAVSHERSRNRGSARRASSDPPVLPSAGRGDLPLPPPPLHPHPAPPRQFPHEQLEHVPVRVEARILGEELLSRNADHALHEGANRPTAG